MRLGQDELQLIAPWADIKVGTRWDRDEAVKIHLIRLHLSNIVRKRTNRRAKGSKTAISESERPVAGRATPSGVTYSFRSNLRKRVAAAQRHLLKQMGGRPGRNFRSNLKMADQEQVTYYGVKISRGETKLKYGSVNVMIGK